MMWCFYLPDDDRSTGWTNHGYVLQHVCSAGGETPHEAWRNAIAANVVPEGYDLSEPPTVAIQHDHEINVVLNAPTPERTAT